MYLYINPVFLNIRCFSFPLWQSSKRESGASKRIGEKVGVVLQFSLCPSLNSALKNRFFSCVLGLDCMFSFVLGYRFVERFSLDAALKFLFFLCIIYCVFSSVSGQRFQKFGFLVVILWSLADWIICVFQNFLVDFLFGFLSILSSLICVIFCREKV